jgi:hypothetical protein
MKVEIETGLITTFLSRGAAAKHEMLIGRHLGASGVQPESS